MILCRESRTCGIITPQAQYSRKYFIAGCATTELWHHKRNSHTRTVKYKKRKVSFQKMVHSCGVQYEANIKPWNMKSRRETEKSIPCLENKRCFFRRLETGLTPRRPRFDTRQFNVGFVVEEVAC
jgi:hypothetical protein